METMGRRFSWASLPPIATVSRLLERDLVLQVEYLRVQCDVLRSNLFTKEAWTFCGMRRAFVLVVMHLRSRTIVLAEAIFSPHGAWMAQQARNTLMVCDDLDIRPRFVLHDRDKSLTPIGRTRESAIESRPASTLAK